MLSGSALEAASAIRLPVVPLRLSVSELIARSASIPRGLKARRPQAEIPQTSGFCNCGSALGQTLVRVR